MKIENGLVFFNENACEVFMNDVMEEKCLQKCEINLILQIESNQNPKSRKKTMKKKLKNYMFKE
jgi:hypothetical protein